MEEYAIKYQQFITFGQNEDDEMKKQVTLKPGKDKAIRHRHHWIFSGAIHSLPSFEDGDLLPVHSAQGDFLGSAYFNRKSSICGRMVCFDQTLPLVAIQDNIDKALAMRARFFSDALADGQVQPAHTNAFRLINGEGDGLPGLVVDKYRDLLVIQIGTLGMDKLRDFLVSYLRKKLNPQCIYEKSALPTRKEEGLLDRQGIVWAASPGESLEEVSILENGLKFMVSPVSGQKTGFFLDHREMRQLVRGLCKGRRVLNCFAYTGGFSVYALAGGAAQVTSVDISEHAVRLAQRNVLLNGFDPASHVCQAADVFQFLRENPLDYEVVILDPPAFAKRQKDVIAACRGYKDINRLALQKMPAKSLLLSSSCSYYVNEELFQKVVFQAAVEAGRNVRIIGRHHMAVDHPVNICHPEGDYLKSLLLYVD